ncbi:hypothetical protein FB451DRAFT_1102918 [Mycena latifolia]|nr:hypothetical protein FB451DRAFT_1102918 [Mycena latifolia]
MVHTPELADGFERCSDLWFSDCGLIIRAANLLFRLSREMLAARSPVFADMLSFPQPEDTETIDGCPVVSLPDAPDQLCAFFRALFDHEFFKPYPATTEFAVISGVLRMSNKYQVDSLRKRALVHLQTKFNPLHKASGQQSWKCVDSDLPLVITLCREMSATWILPLAFYHYTHAFDTTSIILGHPRDGHHISLPREDQAIAVTGFIRLHTDTVSKFLEFFWDDENSRMCSTPMECLTARIQGHRLAESRRNSHIFRIWSLNDTKALGTCVRCRLPVHTRYLRAQAVLFRSLPGIFDLPDWDALEAIKSAALA